MTPRLIDLHIIRIDSIWDDRPVEGIVPMNAAYWTVDKEMDRYERKLLQGTVEAIPMGYSETQYNPLDSGLPPARLFVGHDAIQLQRNYGRKDWGREKYHPGLKERYEYMTVSEYGAMIDLKVGERVYFHPSVTEPENRLEDKLYLATVDQLICGVDIKEEIIYDNSSRFVRIRPQGGFVLVEPVMDTQLESSGIIIKQEAEAVLLEGIVRHTRPGSGLEEGERIYYLENADWALKIEGVIYYAMREEEIIGSKLKTA